MAHVERVLIVSGGIAGVLVEVLREADCVEHALETNVSRRKPRVVWVQQESHAAAQGTNLPLAVRTAALRERGDLMLQHRFVPLKLEV